ncbi:hypothetical protein BOX15_Mlig026350g2, partial [Macrostomum lignano]
MGPGRYPAAVLLSAVLLYCSAVATASGSMSSSKNHFCNSTRTEDYVKCSDAKEKGYVVLKTHSDGVNCQVQIKYRTCCSGWIGSSCSEAVCSPKCDNGMCVAPNSCNCSSGWSGATCNKPVCAKECANGGICVAPNTCRCAAGFDGEQCQSVATTVSSVCVGGCGSNGKCVRGRCVCNLGYKGDKCELPLCKNNCNSVGTCLAPNKCRCPDGYHGDLCQVSALYASDSTAFVAVRAVNNTRYRNSAVCSAFGGKHFLTFDGKYFDFPAHGSYVLLQDCVNSEAKYQVYFNGSRNCADAAQTRCQVSLKIVAGPAKVEIMPGGSVFVNEKPVTLPTIAGIVSVSNTANHITVRGLDDLAITYDGDRNINVYAPKTMSRTVCGLCGRFDGKAANDFTDLMNKPLTHVVDFAKAWRDESPDDKNVYPSVPADAQHPCARLRSKSTSLLESAQSLCSILRSGSSTFSACHSRVNSSVYESMCMKDMCTCLLNGNATVCNEQRCNSATLYSRACTQQGIVINWRQSNLCPAPKCSNGKVFSECSHDCNQKCGTNTVDDDCGTHCVDGCFCPSGRFWDGHKCVIRDNCPCNRAGDSRSYPVGSKYSHKCEQCVCDRGGSWKCSPTDECYGYCTVSGDPTYRTFDGRHFSFEGHCEYIMMMPQRSAAESLEYPVAVYVENKYCDSVTDVLCAKLVTLQMGSGEKQHTIRLESLSRVKVDSAYVSLPVKVHDITIRLVSTSMLRVETNKGFDLLWNGRTRIQIRLSKAFRNKVTGLCGNFNNDMKDDTISPTGIDVKDIRQFAKSWKTNPTCDAKTRFVYNGACATSKEFDSYATSVCNKLYTESVFKACHSRVDPKWALEQCKHDVCSCGSRRKGVMSQCECTAFASYARSCALDGKVLNWRSSSLCPVKCPPTMEYQECGSNCGKTCKRVEASPCIEECVEGCQCPSGQALDEEKGTCVPRNQCKCVYNGVSYTNGQVRKDKCNNCTCTDGNWECTNLTCTDSNTCPAGMVWSECSDCQRSCENINIECPKSSCKSGGCVCPKGQVLHQGKCVDKGNCPCAMAGKVYAENSVVPRGSTRCYNYCMCRKGSWQCTNNKCPSTCRVWGDPHYETFDGRYYDFMGTCSYVLAEDYCGGTAGTFRITGENIKCGAEGMSCTKSVKITYRDVVVHLVRGTDPIISRNLYWPVTLPKAKYEIYPAGFYLFFRTEDGIEVQWDMKMKVSVTLQPNWMEKVCGLCGNFNNKRDDDLRARTGEVVEDKVAFADSWKVRNTCPKPPPTPIAPCSSERKRWAEKKCAILRSSEFTSCHSKVEVNEFYDKCVMDTCACKLDDCLCYCTAVSQYVLRCNEMGVKIKWRNPDDCPVMCPKTMVYKRCGSTCPQRCIDISKGETITSDCKSTCVEGCFCPDGEFLEDGVCKKREQCSCVVGGKKIAYGKKIIYKCQECTCTAGSLECKPYYLGDCATFPTTVPPTTTPFCTGPGLIICRGERKYCAKRCDGNRECMYGDDEQCCHGNCTTTEPATRPPTTTTPLTTTTTAACPAPKIRVDCAPKCPKRCHYQRYTNPTGCSMSEFECESGCVCPSGMVSNGEKCEPESHCMCYDNVAKVVRKPGEKWEVDCRVCECSNNDVKCSPKCSTTCPPGSKAISVSGKCCPVCSTTTTTTTVPTTPTCPAGMERVDCRCTRTCDDVLAGRSACSLPDGVRPDSEGKCCMDKSKVCAEGMVLSSSGACVNENQCVCKPDNQPIGRVFRVNGTDCDKNCQYKVNCVRTCTPICELTTCAPGYRLVQPSGSCCRCEVNPTTPPPACLDKDGVKHSEGSTWRSGCAIYTCSKGVISSRKECNVTCAPGFILRQYPTNPTRCCECERLATTTVIVTPTTTTLMKCTHHEITLASDSGSKFEMRASSNNIDRLKALKGAPANSSWSPDASDDEPRLVFAITPRPGSRTIITKLELTATRARSVEVEFTSGSDIWYSKRVATPSSSGLVSLSFSNETTDGVSATAVRVTFPRGSGVKVNPSVSGLLISACFEVSTTVVAPTTTPICASGDKKVISECISQVCESGAWIRKKSCSIECGSSCSIVHFSGDACCKCSCGTTTTTRVVTTTTAPPTTTTPMCAAPMEPSDCMRKCRKCHYIEPECSSEGKFPCESGCQCPSGYRMNSTNHCVKSEDCSCRSPDGKVRSAGDVWVVDCIRYTCANNTISNLGRVPCKSVTCPAGSMMVTADCCPSCVTKPPTTGPETTLPPTTTVAPKRVCHYLDPATNRTVEKSINETWVETAVGTSCKRVCSCTTAAMVECKSVAISAAEKAQCLEICQKKYPTDKDVKANFDSSCRCGCTSSCTELKVCELPCNETVGSLDEQNLYCLSKGLFKTEPKCTCSEALPGYGSSEVRSATFGGAKHCFAQKTCTKSCNYNGKRVPIHGVVKEVDSTGSVIPCRECTCGESFTMSCNTVKNCTVTTTEAPKTTTAPGCSCAKPYEESVNSTGKCREKICHYLKGSCVSRGECNCECKGAYLFFNGTTCVNQANCYCKDENGALRKNGEKWQNPTDPCKTHMCVDNQIQTSDRRPDCPKFVCPPDSVRQVPPGKCCAVCTPQNVTTTTATTTPRPTTTTPLPTTTTLRCADCGICKIPGCFPADSLELVTAAAARTCDYQHCCSAPSCPSSTSEVRYIRYRTVCVAYKLCMTTTTPPLPTTTTTTPMPTTTTAFVERHVCTDPMTPMRAIQSYTGTSGIASEASPGKSGWRPSTSGTMNEMLTIKLGFGIPFTGFEIKTSNVKFFRVKYSDATGRVFNPYTEASVTKVFSGSDFASTGRFIFRKSFVETVVYVRLEIISFVIPGAPASINFEPLGCYKVTTTTPSTTTTTLKPTTTTPIPPTTTTTTIAPTTTPSCTITEGMNADLYIPPTSITVNPRLAWGSVNDIRPSGSGWKVPVARPGEDNPSVVVDLTRGGVDEPTFLDTVQVFGNAKSFSLLYTKKGSSEFKPFGSLNWPSLVPAKITQNDWTQVKIVLTGPTNSSDSTYDVKISIRGCFKSKPFVTTPAPTICPLTDGMREPAYIEDSAITAVSSGSTAVPVTEVRAGKTGWVAPLTGSQVIIDFTNGGKTAAPRIASFAVRGTVKTFRMMYQLKGRSSFEPFPSIVTQIPANKHIVTKPEPEVEKLKIIPVEPADKSQTNFRFTIEVIGCFQRIPATTTTTEATTTTTPAPSTKPPCDEIMSGREISSRAIKVQPAPKNSIDSIRADAAGVIVPVPSDPSPAKRPTVEIDLTDGGKYQFAKMHRFRVSGSVKLYDLYFQYNGESNMTRYPESSSYPSSGNEIIYVDPHANVQKIRMVLRNNTDAKAENYQFSIHVVACLNPAVATTTSSAITNTATASTGSVTRSIPPFPTRPHVTTTASTTTTAATTTTTAATTTTTAATTTTTAATTTTTAMPTTTTPKCPIVEGMSSPKYIPDSWISVRPSNYSSTIPEIRKGTWTVPKDLDGRLVQIIVNSTNVPFEVDRIEVGGNVKDFALEIVTPDASRLRPFPLDGTPLKGSANVSLTLTAFRVTLRSTSNPADKDYVTGLKVFACLKETTATTTPGITNTATEYTGTVTRSTPKLPSIPSFTTTPASTTTMGVTNTATEYTGTATRSTPKLPPIIPTRPPTTTEAATTTTTASTTTTATTPTERIKEKTTTAAPTTTTT